MNVIWKIVRYDDKESLLIFILALIIRISAALLFRFYIGLPYKFLNYETEGFNDFNYFYLAWAKNFTSLHWYPYSYGNEANALNWYSYPPFFLYLISLFGIPGLPFWAPAIPIVILDAGCAVLVFKILRIYVSKRNALLGALCFCFAAINIFYIGIYWLNPSPMTFFFLLSIYYLIKRDHFLFVLTMVTSVMMKQTALYQAPVLFSLFLGREDLRRWWKPIMLIVILSILFSTPFIFLTPTNYFRHLMVSPGPNLSLNILKPEPDWTITLPQFLKYGLNIKGSLINIISKFINSYSLLFSTMTTISFYSLFATRDNKLRDWDTIFILLINGFLSYIFQPKGLYKYYLSTLMPLLSISIWLGAYQINLTNILSYGLAIIYLSFNVITVFIPRLYTHGLIIVMFGVTIFLYLRTRKIV